MRAVAAHCLAALAGAPLAVAGGIATEGAAGMDASARDLPEGSTWVSGDPAANCTRAVLNNGTGGYELYVGNLGWPFWITIAAGGKQRSALITALKLNGDHLTIVFDDRSRSRWRVETRDRITREGTESVTSVQTLSRRAGPRLSTGLSFPPGQ